MKYFNGKKISSARFDGKRSGEVQFFKPGSLPDIGGQSPTPNLTTPPPRVGRDVFTIIPRGGCDGCVNTGEQRWWGWVEDSDPSQTGEILYLHLSQQPRPNEINSTEIYYTSFPVSGGNNLIGTAIDQVRIVDNGTETVYTASGLLNGINGEGLSENTALDLSTMSVGIRGIRAPDVNQNLVELIDFSFAWNSGAYLTMGGGISLLFRYIQENDASWQGTVGLGFDGYGQLGAEFTPVITRQDLENAASDGKNSQAFKKVLFRPNITNDTACDLTPCVTEPPRTEDPITWWEPPPPTTTTTTTTSYPEKICVKEMSYGVASNVTEEQCNEGDPWWGLGSFSPYNDGTNNGDCGYPSPITYVSPGVSIAAIGRPPDDYGYLSDAGYTQDGSCSGSCDDNTCGLDDSACSCICRQESAAGYYAYPGTYASGECPDGYIYIGDSSTGDNVCCESFLNGIPLSGGTISGTCFYYSPCSPAMEGPNYLP